jgi:arylsulfatase A-like enzyme
MPPDLLVLLCDTARADAFRPWGGPHPTPAIERLCREGIVYERATTPAPWTVPSHASIFSGLLPTEHGINGECFEWVDRRPTSPAAAVRAFAGQWLPEALRARGYRTWGASCNSWISTWGGFDRGFEEFVDLRPQAKPKGRPARLAFRARRALGGTDRGGAEAVRTFHARLRGAGPEPLFAFVNLMETHSPFNPPGRYYPYPAWRRFRTRRLAGGPDQGLSFNAGVVDPGPRYARTLRTIYYACGRYEDHVVGRLLEAVEDRGRPTVVVLVADHGELLGEHGMYNHNSSLHQPLLHVPLAIWSRGAGGPGGGRVEEPVSTVGLGWWLLSVADGAGAGDPFEPDGPVVSEYEGTRRHNGIPDYIRRGIEARNPDVPPLVFHPGVAVREGSLKYLAAGDGGEWLFDLDDDPGEERNLAGIRPADVARFQPRRDEWVRRRAARPEYEAGQVAEGEIAEHLKELGYIE